MGGTIGMIIRKPDGETVPMLRWTNILPHFLSRTDFLRGDFDSWWAEFSKSWELMRDDYQRNESTGRFEQGMTTAYFPHDTLSPEGYGLVVVDFQKKKVSHLQGYCSLGAEQPMHWSRSSDDDAEDLRLRFAEGFCPTLVLSSYYLSRKGSLGTKPELLPEMVNVTIDLSAAAGEALKSLKLLAAADQVKDANLTAGDVAQALGLPLPKDADPNLLTPLFMASLPYRSDWRFTKFEESAAGCAGLRKQLGDDGIAFSATDDQLWTERVLEFLENDEESEDKDDEERLQTALAMLGRSVSVSPSTRSIDGPRP